MATVTTKIDDMDNKTEADTHSFSLDGVTYEIDLSDANHQKLSKLLSPYINASRPVKMKTVRYQRRSVKSQDTTAVRAWARENGFDVGSKGRIPFAVSEAFEKAHA